MLLRLLLVLLVTALVACGSDDGVDDGASDRETSPTAADEPGSPARARVDWFLDVVGEAPIDADALAEGFSEQFLAAVPPDELAATTTQVFASGTGWSVADDGDLGELEGSVELVSDAGQVVVLSLAVDAAEPHLITGAWLQPGTSVDVPEEVTFDELDRLLGGLGETAAYGVYDVAAGDCRPRHEMNGETVLPVGSSFKLWILDALASAIEAGEASWDEELPVDDALKSSTDGEISPLEAGTPVTLRRYAELMISISDNSATDHLLHRLGRARVEEAMAAAVAEPARNIPLLSTRELFLLKYGDQALTERYLQGDTAERRAVLDDLAGVGLLDVLSPTFVPREPTLVHELEWFATPVDLCRTHLRLDALAQRPGLEPVADILSANPGTQFGPEWTHVRFKGGSELGLLHATWWLSGADGERIVIVGGVVDTEEALDEAGAIAVLSAAARAG